MTNIARRGTPLVLAGWFVIGSLALVAGAVLLGGPFTFGSDAIVGAHAARELLAGGNPWATSVDGTFFTGLPTALLLYLPFASVPDTFVAIAWVGISVGASFYSVRRLRLPSWWLFFPPLMVGMLSGSSVPLVLALLLRANVADDLRGVLAGAAAALARPYAVVPALVQRRWRAPLLGLDIALVSVPFLAWAYFLTNLPGIAETTSLQANGGLSAAVSPGLAFIAVAGLMVLGRRRAAWLIVPALLPSAQLAIGALALPVLAEMPIVAATLASPATPGLIGLAIAAQAAVEGLKLREIRHSSDAWRHPRQRRWKPDELARRLGRRAQPGAAERPGVVDHS